MKIRGKKLRELAEQRGLSVQQLAEAVAEVAAMRVDDAASAVSNWMVDRDHPRCKAPYIRRMAEVLGVSVSDIARFTSEVRGHRGSPRKASLLIDLIRGKNVDTARNLLTFNTKKAAVNIKKALDAAITDAQMAEADITRLFVSESRVDQATPIKRFQPKDRGRAHPIIKPLSHITISVEERAAKAGAR